MDMSMPAQLTYPVVYPLSWLVETFVDVRCTSHYQLTMSRVTRLINCLSGVDISCTTDHQQAMCRVQLIVSVCHSVQYHVCITVQIPVPMFCYCSADVSCTSSQQITMYKIPALCSPVSALGRLNKIGRKSHPTIPLIVQYTYLHTKEKKVL